MNLAEALYEVRMMRLRIHADKEHLDLTKDKLERELDAANSKLAKLDRWLIGDRTHECVVEEIISVANLYKDTAYKFACHFKDEDGFPQEEDLEGLDCEEWWGVVSEALERAEAEEGS